MRLKVDKGSKRLMAENCVQLIQWYHDFNLKTEDIPKFECQINLFLFLYFT